MSDLIQIVNVISVALWLAAAVLVLRSARRRS